MNKVLLNKDFFSAGEHTNALFCAEGRGKNMHSHEFWEISYVYEGRGYHHISHNEKKVIKENEFVFISPGFEHCITSPPKSSGALVRVCNCLIDNVFINEIISLYQRTANTRDTAFTRLLSSSVPFCLHLSDNDDAIHNTLMTAAYESRNFSVHSDIILKNSLLNFLLQCSRIYEAQLCGYTVKNNKNEVLDELIRYIKSNFGTRLTLEFLAEYSHFSREYLSRYFKQYTGKGISEFIRDIRIERARQLLRSSTHSVADISAYCGYPSVSNFQKAFKHVTGMSASEYRRRCADSDM